MTCRLDETLVLVSFQRLSWEAETFRVSKLKNIRQIKFAEMC